MRRKKGDSISEDDRKDEGRILDGWDLKVYEECDLVILYL